MTETQDPILEVYTLTNSNSSADILLGGSGDDTIDGGEGADLIVGGTGADTLTGGADADIFAFGPGDGNDTITDFNKDEDTINLSMFGAGADTFVVEPGQTLTTIGDFTDGEDQIDLSNISGITGFSDLTMTDDNGTAVIDLSAYGGGTIRLTDVATTDLDADDFVFAGSTSMVDDGM